MTTPFLYTRGTLIRSGLLHIKVSQQVAIFRKRAPSVRRLKTEMLQPPPFLYITFYYLQPFPGLVSLYFSIMLQLSTIQLHYRVNCDDDVSAVVDATCKKPLPYHTPPQTNSCSFLQFVDGKRKVNCK